MSQTLETLCNFINGGAWSDKEYVTTGIPVLKVSNLKVEGIDFSNINYIAESSLSKYSKHLLAKDDLVIATVGSHPSLVNSAAGRATIISTLAAGYLLNQNAVLLRSKDEKVLNQKYLSFLGKTNNFQHYIQQRGKGAANQMRIAIGAIKEFEIKLPPINEQHRIASILSAYGDLIENNSKRIKLLEELAQRTYEEWFVKFRVNGVQSEIGENGLPEGWHDVELIKLIKFYKGKKANLINSEYREGLVKLLLLNGIESGVYPYTEPKGQVLVERTDLIMLMDGARSSKVFFADKGAVGSTLSKIEILDERISSSLLKLYFDKNFDWMQTNNTGAAIPHANKSFINSMPFLLPTDIILVSWKKKIDPIFKQIQTLKDQNLLLKESRDILLPRLMSGKIDVDKEVLGMVADVHNKYLIQK